MKYKLFLALFSFFSLSVSAFSSAQEELSEFLGKLSLSSSVSSTNESLFSVEDVQRSAMRCCEVFNGNYDSLPIFDLTANANVGRIQYQEQGNQVFISFRGSQGFQETISNLSSNPVELLSHFNILGNGHEVLFKSYQGLRANQRYDSPMSFFDAIRALGTIDKEEKGLAGLQFTIDGHSRGAALGVYTALGLNADEELSIKPSQIRVLTYGSVDCLDQQAAESYNQIFVGRHLNFKANEDTISALANSSGMFPSLGQQISFSAQESQGYRGRVTRKEFSHMENNVRNLLRSDQLPLLVALGNMFKPALITLAQNFGVPSGVVDQILNGSITINTWEAHMPETYKDLAHLAYQKTLGNS